MKAFIVGLLATLLSAGVASSSTPQFLYGLSEDQLSLLGLRLGYHVENLGMDDYSFTRDKHVFHVVAHTDISVSRRVQADGPVLIIYKPPGRVPPVTSRFFVERGVTFAAVEDHFRRFLRKMHLPATTPARVQERRLAGCASAPREVSGTLVSGSAHAPAAGQRLVLDRPPGYYGNIPFAMFIFGVPQQTTISTAVTDARGHFRFVTSKDRRRQLSVHLAAVPTAAGLQPPHYRVTSLQDSQHPLAITYDDRLYYDTTHHWHLRP